VHAILQCQSDLKSNILPPSPISGLATPLYQNRQSWLLVKKYKKQFKNEIKLGEATRKSTQPILPSLRVSGTVATFFHSISFSRCAFPLRYRNTFEAVFRT